LNFLDSGHSNNEAKSFLLVDELHLINKNLNTLGQLLKQRTTRLLQTDIPTSNDDLLLLYQEHKVSLNLLWGEEKKTSKVLSVVMYSSIKKIIIRW